MNVTESAKLFSMAFLGLLDRLGRLLLLPFTILVKYVPAIHVWASKIAKDSTALQQLEQEALFLAHSNTAMPERTRHLLKGERREAAELIAPQAAFRHLYQNVPADLARSIIEDGRICNGTAPAVALAGSTITPEYVENAWRSATRSAMNAAYLVFMCWAIFTLVTVWGGMKINDAFGDKPAAATEEKLRVGSFEMQQVAQLYRDVWQESDAREVLEDQRAADASVARAGRAGAAVQVGLGAVIFLVISLAAGLVAAAAAARIRWIGRLRYLVFAAANASVEGLRHNWREALQRWRWRLPERDMLLSAYADQVHFSTAIDRSPLIELGVASGLLEHRGHLLAPLKGTPIRMSIIDLLQHVEVLGGSGEGKSRNFYVPVVRQLIQLRKQGFPISIYATDDKGAIGDDIVAEVKAAGLSEDEVLRIGTGPNDWRIDLCAGLGPVELAEIIRSVSAQMGGSSSDDFWPEMASDLIAQIGILLQAVELTDAGKEWAAENKMRVHSILNLLRVAGSDILIRDNLRIVTEALNRDSEGDLIEATVHLPQLNDAMSYLANSYIPLAAATKDGIRANMRKVLVPVQT